MENTFRLDRHFLAATIGYACCEVACLQVSIPLQYAEYAPSHLGGMSSILGDILYCLTYFVLALVAFKNRRTASFTLPLLCTVAVATLQFAVLLVDSLRAEQLFAIVYLASRIVTGIAYPILFCSFVTCAYRILDKYAFRLFALTSSLLVACGCMVIDAFQSSPMTLCIGNALLAVSAIAMLTEWKWNAADEETSRLGTLAGEFRRHAMRMDAKALGYFLACACLISFVYRYVRIFASEVPYANLFFGMGLILSATIILIFATITPKATFDAARFFSVFTPIICILVLCTSWAAASLRIIAFLTASMASGLSMLLIKVFCANFAWKWKVPFAGIFALAMGAISVFPPVSIALAGLMPEVNTTIVLIIACLAALGLHRRAPESNDESIFAIGLTDHAAIRSYVDEHGKSATDRSYAVHSLSESSRLTGKEREVLEYLAKGRDVPYIADEMCVSKGTVRTHIKHIYQKTGVHSRQELLNLIEEKEVAGRL